VLEVEGGIRMRVHVRAGFCVRGCICLCVCMCGGVCLWLRVMVRRGGFLGLIQVCPCEKRLLKSWA